jgi:hypothetical protein
MHPKRRTKLSFSQFLLQYIYSLLLVTQKADTGGTTKVDMERFTFDHFELVNKI